MRSCFVFLLTCIIVSCASKSTKIKRLNFSGEYYEEGKCFNDSIFDGVVKRYDLKGNYLGYSNYNYGVLDGIFTNKYQNGMTKDSIVFRNNHQEGLSYKFDSLGRKIFAANYYNDRIVGATYVFDSSKGNISEFSFRNFEGVFVYHVKYGLQDTIVSGNLLNFKLDTLETSDGIKKQHLFLYLIMRPDVTMHYEIAKVLGKEIISSEKVKSNNLFYETDLEFLSKEEKYAIILASYNNIKKRDDVSVYVLE